MRSIPRPLALAALAGAASLQVTAVLAQPIGQGASNITRYDSRSTIAPRLPVPPVSPNEPPRSFLLAARTAVERGRSGEAQEALERAETRLLDRSLSRSSVRVPDDRRAVRDIATARRAIAARDRSATLRAIDDALAADTAVAQAYPPPGAASRPSYPQSSASVRAYPPPLGPSVTYALLPGHWQLRGARWIWVPPDTRLRPVQAVSLTPGRYVWLNGAYVWVPAHYGYP